MAKKRAFGELELTIMKTVKTLQEATVRQVQDSLGGQDSYTTIMTVLHRLYEKGQLKRRREGRQYCYHCCENKPTEDFGLLERLKAKIFGGKSHVMINYLIESDEISEEELKAIEEVIASTRFKNS